MCNHIKSVLVFIFILFMVSGCNSPETKHKNESVANVGNQVILTGSYKAFIKHISFIIDQSDIRQTGYAVILSSANNSDKEVTELKNALYDQEVTAVHVFNPDFKAGLKKSDVIMIKNASIIIMLNGTRKFTKWSKSVKLPRHLKRAKKNGAVIVGIGQGAYLLGQSYFTDHLNKKTGKYTINKVLGLRLIRNTMFCNLQLYRKVTKAINKEVENSGVVFFGLSKSAVVSIKNNVAKLISGSVVSNKAPGHHVELINIGDSIQLSGSSGSD